MAVGVINSILITLHGMWQLKIDFVGNFVFKRATNEQLDAWIWNGFTLINPLEFCLYECHCLLSLLLPNFFSFFRFRFAHFWKFLTQCMYHCNISGFIVFPVFFGYKCKRNVCDVRLFPICILYFLVEFVSNFTFQYFVCFFFFFLAFTFLCFHCHIPRTFHPHSYSLASVHFFCFMVCFSYIVFAVKRVHPTYLSTCGKVQIIWMKSVELCSVCAVYVYICSQVN